MGQQRDVATPDADSAAATNVATPVPFAPANSASSRQEVFNSLTSHLGRERVWHKSDAMSWLKLVEGERGSGRERELEAVPC